MQITLNQDEILNALDIYVRSQISIAQNQRVDIRLRAGRGEDGYTATLDIVSNVVIPGPVKTTPVYRESMAETAPPPAASAPVAPANAQAVARKPFGLIKPAAAAAPVEEAPTPQDETPEQEEVAEVSTTSDDTDGENQIAPDEVSDEAPAEPTPVKRSIFAKAGKA